MLLALALPFSTLALVPALLFVALVLASPFSGLMLELREPNRDNAVAALLEAVSPLPNTHLQGQRTTRTRTRWTWTRGSRTWRMP